MRFRLLVLAAALSWAGSALAQTPTYQLTHSYTLGGNGGWDYIALDSVGHRLFIGRQTRVMVVDQKTGKLLAEIPGLKSAHGVAFDYASGHGFATSGGDSSVVMFDLQSLKVLGRTLAADDADAILYDPSSRKIFTMNGDANSSSVIDPASGKRVANIDLGGKPEFGVASNDGRIFVNLEDKAEIVEVDAAAMKVLRRWPIAPCASPTGMAIDRAHHVLFSGCRNKLMAVSDAAAGRLLTTLPIGSGVDANRFDSATGLAFASNGDGTLTVVHEESPTQFRLVQTVTTMAGARTMELDPSTHTIYTVSARFGPAPAESTAANPRRRPPVIPDSFTLLVLEP